jgi:DNA-binding transcriptional ArsR family regulator
MDAPALEVATVPDRRRAAALLKPLRLEILRQAAKPASAAAIAQTLGLPRQRVTYHVRQLARAGFLRKAGRQQRRGFIEQRWIATARSYVLLPGALGPLGDASAALEDRLSAGALLAMGARLQDEVARASSDATRRGQRVATLSLESEFRFESAPQRRRFAEALRDAVTRVVAEHASPARTAEGAEAPGRPYRLVIGCYPIIPRRPARKEKP